MKVIKELNYKVSIKAILDDEGNLKLSISAIAPYGNRTATATVEDFSEEDLASVQKVLSKILEDEGPRAIILGEQAAATSYSVAVAMGEAI